MDLPVTKRNGEREREKNRKINKWLVFIRICYQLNGKRLYMADERKEKSLSLDWGEMKDIKFRPIGNCSLGRRDGNVYVAKCDMITARWRLVECVYCGRATIITAQHQYAHFDVNIFRFHFPKTLDTLSLSTTFYERCRENQFHDLFVGCVFIFSHRTCERPIYNVPARIPMKWQSLRCYGNFGFSTYFSLLFD